MKKRSLVLILVMFMLAAAGCGGNDDDKKEGGDTPPSTTIITPAPTEVSEPAPRSHTLPEVAPYDFEAPFSVSTFVRQSAQGRPTSTGTGGLQATYQLEQNIVTLTIYYFATADEASRTAQFALKSGSMVEMVEPLYVGPAITFGIAQDRHGGYLAAWSHEGWCFLVATPNGLDILNSFLESFPY
jgi:hypothetical protein